MTDDQAVPLPDEAVERAADAIHRHRYGNTISGLFTGHEIDLASVALEAAADALRAQGAAAEREACARLAESEAQHMADEDEIEMSAGMMHVADLIRARNTP